MGGPMGKVGDGAVADLAVLAKALAEQDGGRGVPLGDDRNLHADGI